MGRRFAIYQGDITSVQGDTTKVSRWYYFFPKLYHLKFLKAMKYWLVRLHTCKHVVYRALQMDSIAVCLT